MYDDRPYCLSLPATVDVKFLSPRAFCEDLGGGGGGGGGGGRGSEIGNGRCPGRLLEVPYSSCEETGPDEIPLEVYGRG